jgi:cyclopropane fatty-acyl-phospholipid synthase-like methyltransferase
MSPIKTAVESRYFDGTYLSDNPDWDRKDANWKGMKVKSMLDKHKIIPTSLCEVGCGSGDIIVYLKKHYLETKMIGFDISPHVCSFWQDHTDSGVTFLLGDFHEINRLKFDVLVMCDVFEHVRDPYTFLERSKVYGEYFVFHIPLDLSAFSVARQYPIMQVRKKVGHLHSYTKDLALATLHDCGYEILDWQYTGASFNSPSRTWKTRMASLVRKLLSFLGKDFSVRLMGGETLLVLAK